MNQQIDNSNLVGKEWRDAELNNTDWVSMIPDHPHHESYKKYRQELRDWPVWVEDVVDSEGIIVQHGEHPNGYPSTKPEM
tara:strand:+ start:1260 stop:1499 length:240 start_codon:yes stop_codon:yes gene_type:complete